MYTVMIAQALRLHETSIDRYWSFIGADRRAEVLMLEGDIRGEVWWLWVDSNYRPHHYE